MGDYEIVFTATAKRRFGDMVAERAAAATIRADIAAHLDDLDDLQKLALHVVRMDATSEKEGIWICHGVNAGTLEVDSGHFREGPTLVEGPFAGKTLVMPVSDEGPVGDFDFDDIESIRVQGHEDTDPET